VNANLLTYKIKQAATLRLALLADTRSVLFISRLLFLMFTTDKSTLSIQHATQNLAEIIKEATSKSPEQAIALIHLELVQLYAQQAVDKATNRTS